MVSRESATRGSRTRARRLAMQALYQWILTAQPWERIYQQFADSESARGADLDYLRTLLGQSIERRAALIPDLAAALDRPFEQVDPIERAILLLATYELAHCPDVPFRVVINEAVELAKRYGASGSHRYVNGVLDKTAASLRASESGRGCLSG